jgi:hypothetical protein
MEDYIEELRQKLIEADGGSEEFHTIAAELQSALSRHIEQTRTRLKQFPIPPERRNLNL